MADFRVAHLSDIHYPVVLPALSWRRRWEAVAQEIRSFKPNAVVISGDLIDSSTPGWVARRAMEDVLTRIRESLGPVDVVVVPGNHDLRCQGIGPASADLLAALRSKHPEFLIDQVQPGATVAELVGRVVGDVHFIGINSNATEFLARGRLTEDCFIPIPASCRGKHLHVAMLHHHLLPEPARTGENPITSSDYGLRLRDAPAVREFLVREGYELVLHGHRHLGTAYRDADVGSYSDPLWIVGAPSATAKDSPGFNIIQFRGDRTFDVHWITRTQDRWLRSNLLARRSYEAVRAGRRNILRERGIPSADSLSVEISAVDDMTGDIKFGITILGLKATEATRLEFPVSLVQYSGVQLRALRATSTDEHGRDSNVRVADDGRLEVEHLGYVPRLTIEGALMNAVPTRPGDWGRMRASHRGLAYQYEITPRYPSRFLSARLPVPAGARFITVVDGIQQRSELPFTDFERIDDQHTRITAFEADPSVSYCVAFDEEHVEATPSVPARAARLREVVEAIPRLPAESPVRHAAVAVLDSIRQVLVDTSREWSGRADAPTDDLMVNLMSIPSALHHEAPTGLSLVLTDSTTEGLVRAGRIKPRIGEKLPWGLGVAGRALRQTSWTAWSRRERAGHPSTWRLEDPYVVRENTEQPHQHLLCAPLVMRDDDGAGDYAYAVLSCSTWDPDSVLRPLVAAFLRQNSERVLELQKRVGALATDLVLHLLKRRPSR